MFQTIDLRQLSPAIVMMAVVVVISNILVQYPVNYFGLEELLTYGAFTYPIAFLITDLTNRRFGPEAARRVVYVGFALGVAMSLVLADARIALASGTAFLVAQLLDVFIFDRLRRASWWVAPISSSTLGSVIDTALFFTIAFAGTGLPWVGWASGDLAVKLVVAMVMLVPFRLLMALVRTRREVESERLAAN